MLITKGMLIVVSTMTLLASTLPLMAVTPKNHISSHQKIIITTKGLNKDGMPTWSTKIKVPYRSWIPVEKPNAVLLCVHGLGFSSQSFTEFGRRMASHGFAVYALDVRGFGEWMKRQGEAQVDFEACLSDIESALRTLRTAYLRVPIFLVGESMGGAIGLRATSRYPDLVNGLVSSVPSSDRYAKLSSELIVGTRYLTNKNQEMSITPEVMNRATANPTLRAKWEAEPTNRLKMTPKELKLFDDFMKGNNDAAVLVANTPVLMLAGFKDKLVRPEGTISLFNELSTQDKLLMVVGDGEHLLLEENQLTDQLAQLIIDWIKNEAHASQPGITVQTKSMQEVNAAQKSTQLTAKEANKLRKDLSEVARKKAKILAKTKRKLNADEAAELRTGINKIDDNIREDEQKKGEQPR